MSAAFKKYLVASGLSMTGDWLRMIMLNWVIIQSLHGSSGDNLLRSAFCSLAPLLLLLLPVKRLRVGPIMIVATSFAMISSLVWAYLLWTNQMSFSAALTFEATNAVFAVYSIPARQAYFKSISPTNQRVAQFMHDYLFWFARMAAGLLILPLSGYGLWVVFVIDALSFLPLLYVFVEAFMNGSICVGIHQEDSVEVSLVRGWKALLQGGRGVAVICLASIDGIVFGLGFTAVSEIVHRELGGDMRLMSWWLFLTGIGSLLGTLLGGHFSKHKSSTSMLMCFACTCTGLSFLYLVGQAQSFQMFCVFYVFLTFFSAPTGSLRSAHFRDYPKTEVASIARVNQLNQIGDSWFRYGACILAEYFHLMKGEMLSLAALIALGLVAAILVVGLTLAPGILNNWYTESPKTENT